MTAALAIAAKNTAGDIIDRLPEPVKAQLVHLRDIRDDIFARTRMLSDRRLETGHNREDAQLQRARLTSERLASVVFKPDDPEVVAVDQKIANLTRECDRLTRLMDERAEERQAAGLLVDRLEAYLGRLEVSSLRFHTGKLDADPKRGEHVTAAVERVRGRIQELAAERQRVLTAPITMEAARRIAHAQIEALAEQGAVSVLGTLSSGGPLRFPELQIRSQVFSDNRTSAFASTPNALATLAWLLRPQLLQAIDQELVAAADEGSALTDAERAKRLAQVDADMLESERIEEHLIRAAASSGIQIIRRCAADSRAICDLSSDLPAPEQFCNRRQRRDQQSA